MDKWLVCCQGMTVWGISCIPSDCLVGLVVTGVHLESARSGVRIPFATGFFPDGVIPVTQKLALQRLPCQTPGVIGSALGLAGQVSVYCDWVRWKV